MKGQEIHTLLTVLADNLKEQIGIDIRRIAGPADCFIDRNRPDRGIEFEDLLPDCNKVAAGREIHQRIGTVGERCLCLLLFKGGIAPAARCPDIHVDLDRAALANGTEPVLPGRVFRDHDPAVSDPAAEPFRIHTFRPCHGPQFPGKPFFAPADEQIHKKHLF